MARAEMPYELGNDYGRQHDIHRVYGGQEQGGISTPVNQPFIFLFTGPTGGQFGYQDGWITDGVFRYTGEGQRGDMPWVRGNRAIRDHISDGKDLLLFESVERGRRRFLGTFACTSWEYRDAPDVDGNNRRAIVFHLVPTKVAGPTQPVEVDSSTPIAQLRESAYANATTAVEQSASRARTTYYQRSEAVRTYVLAQADGRCESCGGNAPFNRPDGSPYLEPHHTRRVSDGGPDHPRWVAAVCPNCHAEIHHGDNGEKLNTELKEALGRIEADATSEVELSA